MTTWPKGMPSHSRLPFSRANIWEKGFANADQRPHGYPSAHRYLEGAEYCVYQRESETTFTGGPGTPRKF